MKKFYLITVYFLFIHVFGQPHPSLAVPVPENMIWENTADGTPVYIEGDEHWQRFYIKGPDKENYTVVKDKDGKWHYATNRSDKGDLTAAAKVGEAVLPPAEAKDLKPKGQALLEVEQHLQAFEQSMNEINARHLEVLSQNKVAGQPTTYYVHTVFVEFPDVPHTYESGSFLAMLYSKGGSQDSYLRTPDGNVAYGSLRDYWHEVSRGQMDVQGEAYYPSQGSWFMMPQTRGYYDEAGRAEFYQAVIATTGAELKPNDKLAIIAAGPPTNPDGVFWPHTSQNYVVLTETFFNRFLPMGVAAHEFGHLLLGLPDYYYSTHSLGLMGTGAYGFWERDERLMNPEKPVHLCAVERVKAGLAEIDTISGEGIENLNDYLLPPVETTGRVLHLNNEDNDTDFYLEVRQPANNVFDSDITGESAGLVVWFSAKTAGGHFPNMNPVYFREKAGYFNASGSPFYNYWGNAIHAAYPGLSENTQIGYDTLPSFIGNQFTNLHHLINIRTESYPLPFDYHHSEPQENPILTSSIEFSEKDSIPVPFEPPIKLNDDSVQPIAVRFDLERWYFPEKIGVILLDDDNTGFSHGDGDGTPEAGERVEAVFRIKNQSAQTTPPSTGSFHTDGEMRYVGPGPENASSFSIPEILPGGHFDTPPLIFDIYSGPSSGIFHQVSLVHNSQFTFSKFDFIGNEPPVLNTIGSRGANQGEHFEFTVSASDANVFDELTLSASYKGGPLPLGAQFLDHRDRTGIFSWTPPQAGIFQPFHFEATDGFSTDSKDITIAVRPAMQEFLITPYAGTQRFADVSGNRIAWEDNRDFSQVFMRDFGPDNIPLSGDDIEYQITSGPYIHSLAAIDGNKIVWTDGRAGVFNPDIYMYHLGADGISGTFDAGEGEYQITLNPNFQAGPDIDGNKIVWLDRRNGANNLDIYMYYLGADGIPRTQDAGEGEYRITVNSAHQSFPAISGNKIVWQDSRNGNNDIYMYNLGADGIPQSGDAGEGEYRITSNSASQVYPAIHSNKIAWTDSRNGGSDIYMYNLGEDGVPATHDAGEGEYLVWSSQNAGKPAIFNNTIVWSDQLGIYLYNLGGDGIPNTGDKETIYPVAISMAGNPAIFKNRVVWEANSNVYLGLLPE